LKTETFAGYRNMEIPTHLFALTALSLLAVAAGCGRSRPDTPPAATPPPRLAARTSAETRKLVGVVRFSDPATGRVTIRHEAIPGFMDAMTMPFTLKNRQVLDDVHPGDEVEGTLRIDRENGEVRDYELTDLVVARPAPAPSLSLNLAGGKAELKEAVRPLKPGERVPDFTVTDEDGKTLKLSDLRGKAVALTFIYTRCPLPDFCPRMDRKFSELAGKVGAVAGRAEGMRLLSVSFDPEHDTPDVLKKHARAQGARPPLWTFAVASHEELARVAQPLGLAYGPGKNEVIHNLVLAVIGPDGRLVRLETGPAARSWGPAEILKTMYERMEKTKN